MGKVKLTKGEMKKQRDELKQFQRYLPTLQLKKQQLQMKILEIRHELQKQLEALYKVENEIKEWKGLLCDPYVNLILEEQEDDSVDNEKVPKVELKKAITPSKITTKKINIAGANVPEFEEIVFEDVPYDLYAVPLWVDQGIEKFRKLVESNARVQVVKKQLKIIENELRVTTQRVNLFEKIKIPEAQDNIRIIAIYLGDQQANAVGISKVAKKKVEIRNAEMALT